MVFTGNAKGKPTAALGMALRAVGHGIKVGEIQFIKGSRNCGEREAVKRFGELLFFHVTGRNASEGLLAAADLVTEMHAVKHPYAAGIKA